MKHQCEASAHRQFTVEHSEACALTDSPSAPALAAADDKPVPQAEAVALAAADDKPVPQAEAPALEVFGAAAEAVENANGACVGDRVVSTRQLFGPGQCGWRACTSESSGVGAGSACHAPGSM